MATRKADEDKNTRPEYIPVTIWEEYQECQDEPETRGAFERVMFGDSDQNSQRAMERTWRAIEKARKIKLNYLIEKSDRRLSSEYERFDDGGTYGAFAMHIKNLAYMLTEDFSKMQSPGNREARLRDMVRTGTRFLNLFEGAYGVSDYGECGLEHNEWVALRERVVGECNRPGSKIDWAIREAAMDVSVRAYGREAKGNGKEYLFSEECNNRRENRRAIIDEYENVLRETIIPMVIDCTLSNFRLPLRKRLRDALEDMEEEAFFVMHDSHILPRPDVSDRRKTYMMRYLAGCFCTMFCIPPDKPLALTMLGEAGIISPLGRIVGAILSEEVTREDVKNILKGYPPDGIRVKKEGEEDDEG